MSQDVGLETQLRLVVHQLQFTLEAQTRVEFGRQAGAQLRGALWVALEQFACTDPRARTPEHQMHCPMCRLVALELGTAARGANPPRPFAIRPPLSEQAGDECAFNPGETFHVGISLFGDAADLFPYICQAVYRMGKVGVGYGRGQFVVRSIDELNPLSGESAALFADGKVRALPFQPITHEQAVVFAERLPADRLTLRFRTPTQITGDDRICVRPEFDKLIGRLIERCQAMETYYTEYPAQTEAWRTLYLELLAQARSVALADDQTHWLKVMSGSRRSGKYNTISGFVGSATFVGNLASYRYWLVWGSVLNIGKNAVKGNGWYEIAVLEH